MKKRYIYIIIIIILSISNKLHPEEQAFQWQTAAPETQNMISSKLDSMKNTLAAIDTRKLLIIRNDKIVYEWYAPDYGPDKKHYTASLAKALAGGMSFLIALNDSLVNINDPACKFIPAWKNDPVKSKIKLLHLATHTSGIENAKEGTIPNKKIQGWKGDFWRQEPDPFTISRDIAPVIFTPGTQYEYSNTGMAMLAYAVTASIKNQPQKDIRTLLRERIMKPIEINDEEWSIGYEKTFKIDGLNLVANWGGGEFTSRAVAKVGRLMMRKGNWEGKQLVDSAWVEKMLKYAEQPEPDRFPGDPVPASGLCWYTNYDKVWKKVPSDAFAGAGANNQILLVVPSLNLILVRNGKKIYDIYQNESLWSTSEQYLFNPVIEAISKPPYPYSRVITGVEFAPDSTVIRKAEGSDVWPITWADDDYLYTAYGDGWGFEPKTKKKLSMGFAKVAGQATDFKGMNIQSPDEQKKAGGGTGVKPCGMLFIDNILYMWTRNAVPVSNKRGERSKLAWSTDYAKNWTWADWTFPFGYPTFINFGKNYDHARDEYVYAVTHDHISAYDPSDRFILMRVPKNRIKDRNTYEFFKNKDQKGNPVWTSNIKERGAVFTNQGRCYRSGICYNPGLKRYLWWQALYPKFLKDGESVDLRSKGGFAIYDAPEPWGPWTTVYYIEEWDMGPGETGSFPVKWMSEDGKSCYLLFSGNDCFSVRKVIFEIQGTIR
jgi:CubicO group peptidase (beta-lactamase class C family)